MHFRHLRRLALAGLLLAGAAAPAVANDSILRLVIRGPVVEAPTDGGELAVLFGEDPVRTLRDWTETIETAAGRDDIRGMALIIEEPLMSLAQLEEIRAAMQTFRDTGKRIDAYLDVASNLSYALAASADHITIAEHSILDIHGLAASLSFYKPMLDNIGVSADLMAMGDYKTAVEPWTRSEPSAANREMVNWLLDSLYDRWIAIIAEGRDLSPAQVKQAVNQAPLGVQQALELGLVDAVGGFTSFKNQLYARYGEDVKVVKRITESNMPELDTSNPFGFFQFFQDMMDREDDETDDGVGLIYVDGPIVMGTSEVDMFGSSASAGSSTIRKALLDTLEDDEIKAVVLRVNSPGGSALASDIMWNAAMQVRERKPLIVSMGGVAGSGGYYVAAPGEVIFADKSTLTGSIGVLGGKLVWKELWEEHIGVNTVTIARGANATLFNPNEPFTEEGREHMRDMLEKIYSQFKERVRAGRGDRLTKQLDDIAGGRVYTGEQALELGLVDRIGTLDDAIDFAARRAGLEGDPEIYVLPRPLDLSDVLAALFDKDTEDEFEIAASLSSTPQLRGLIQLVRRTFGAATQHMSIDLKHLEILHRERFGCFMPLHVNVR